MRARLDFLAAEGVPVEDFPMVIGEQAAENLADEDSHSLPPPPPPASEKDKSKVLTGSGSTTGTCATSSSSSSSIRQKDADYQASQDSCEELEVEPNSPTSSDSSATTTTVQHSSSSSPHEELKSQTAAETAQAGLRGFLSSLKGKYKDGVPLSTLDRDCLVGVVKLLHPRGGDKARGCCGVKLALPKGAAKGGKANVGGKGASLRGFFLMYEGGEEDDVSMAKISKELGRKIREGGDEGKTAEKAFWKLVNKGKSSRQSTRTSTATKSATTGGVREVSSSQRVPVFNATSNTAKSFAKTDEMGEDIGKNATAKSCVHTSEAKV